MTAEIPRTADGAGDLATIFDSATLVRKGLCPVTEVRAKKGNSQPTESHSLYFEQHGSGPNKILFIMGLNATSFSWLPQVEHFGRSPEYSVLVFDNRGVGNSDSPRGPYSTSSMAEDVIVLLDHVGWTQPRDLHVVGVSMGGMIAQELATRIPDRIISLSLVVTTPGGRPWNNMPSWKGLSGLARIMTKKDPEQIIPIVLEMMYPVSWLDSKREDGKTNREAQTEVHRRRAAITRPQTLMGHVSQMVAGSTHHVTADRLHQIAKSIPHILIITGDDDHLVDTRNSDYLAAQMPEARFVKWEGTGHGVPAQWPGRFNVLLEEVFQEGKKRVHEGWKPSA